MRYRRLILEQRQVRVEGRSSAELQVRARGTHACCIQVRTEYQTQGQAGTQLPVFSDLQTSSKWVPGNIRPSKMLHGKTACGQTREGTLLLEPASGKCVRAARLCNRKNPSPHLTHHCPNFLDLRTALPGNPLGERSPEKQRSN